jgi:hypothetical protein
MKKLLLLLFSLILSFNSYGKELNTLFGITLYDNAEKYVSSDYIDSNKFKNDETIDGYFTLVITDEIKTKSPYASWYQIIIDNDNKVHRIYGDSEFTNLDICQAVLKDLISKFEKKYTMNFEYFDESFPDFKIYSHWQFADIDNTIRIQCRESYHDSSTLLQMMLTTFVLGEAVNEFYDSGL